MLNKVRIDGAFRINTFNKNLLVFKDFDGSLKKGDILINDTFSLRVIGVMPNLLSNTLSVEVDGDSFDPDRLLGAELAIEQHR